MCGCECALARNRQVHVPAGPQTSGQGSPLTWEAPGPSPGWWLPAAPPTQSPPRTAFQALEEGVPLAGRPLPWLGREVTTGPSAPQDYTRPRGGTRLRRRRAQALLPQNTSFGSARALLLPTQHLEGNSPRQVMPQLSVRGAGDRHTATGFPQVSASRHRPGLGSQASQGRVTQL